MAQDDANKTFTSMMLRESNRLVKQIIPSVKFRKDAWVYLYSGSDSAEFHTRQRKDAEGNIVIHEFYTSFNAYNAAEAKEKGWTAYLKQFHPKEYYAEEEREAQANGD